MNVDNKCECGCGGYVKAGKRFIWGHHVRVNNPMHDESSKKKISMAVRERFKDLRERRKLSMILKGRKFSENHKQKLSENHADFSGSNNPMFGRSGKDCPFFGRRHSEQTKQRMSKSQLGRVFTKEHREKISRAARKRCRDPEYRMRISMAKKKLYEDPRNCPGWKGGISHEPYCEIWSDKEYKESIKRRDNYRCQNPNCWGVSNRLCIHHIDYNKKNCHPWNLITLCISCNMRANYNREYWKELYTKLDNKNL